VICDGARAYEATRRGRDLLHDDKAIYYGTGAGSVRRVAKNGSRVQTLHNVDREGSPHIAIGGEHVYFVTPGERGIRRFRLAVE
jgi:hypothetical protein